MTAPTIDATCSGCGRCPQMHDSVTDPGSPPGPGDTSLCWRCLAISVFELSPLGVLVLRAPTVEEQREIQTDPVVAITIRCRTANPGDPAGAVAAAIPQIRALREASS